MKNKELNLQEIQQGSFKVLLKIKEIFDKNGWDYYLTYGTLIGAIRHNGFIPWDDDIDIWVPRPDYEKFINYCIEHEKELKPFELIHYKTNDRYIYPIARFSDSRYKIDYKDAKNYGLGLFVDIYPLDGNKKFDFINILKIRFLIHKAAMCGSSGFVKTKNIFKNILKMPFYHLYKNSNITKVLKKIDELAKKYPYESNDNISCTCWGDEIWNIKKSELKEGKILTHEFNGIELNIPKEYDKILKMFYKDYMSLPPENERIAHHFYKAYKK